MDEDGYVFFRSRADDVITSSGYRIGPSEIEDCLTGHPDVALAGVVGVPDPIRTEAVKAFVVLREGASPAGLDVALIARVRTRLSPHVAPREVVFVESLPMTATGKIRRRALREGGAADVLVDEENPAQVSGRHPPTTLPPRPHGEECTGMRHSHEGYVDHSPPPL
jgi:acetyl-CoA synthetase